MFLNSANQSLVIYHSAYVISNIKSSVIDFCVSPNKTTFILTATGEGSTKLSAHTYDDYHKTF